MCCLLLGYDTDMILLGYAPDAESLMFDIRLYKQIIDLWVNYKRVVLNQKPNRGPQSDLKLLK